VPLLIAAGGGAIIGGAASGILYAISHPCDDLLNSPSFWRAVGAGAVGGFVAGLLPIGGSLGAAIVWGMVGGASSATASQLFVNLTTPGANWDNDLVGAAITGGIAGGVFGGVGYGVRQWLTLSLLERRAQQIHSALDPIAQTRRTTAVLQTDAGRIVAGGVRDLTPTQRHFKRQINLERHRWQWQQQGQSVRDVLL
jgi:hypothetical protein